jgi:clorobiocin biosynthesis protein CloN5
VTHALSEDETATRLLAFVRERFLSGDPQGELDEYTPLLEWGILNSFNTAVLISYIRSEFGTPVALEKVNAATFKNIRSISSMMCGSAGPTG